MARVLEAVEVEKPSFIFSFFGSESELEQEMVEEYFFLVSRFLEYCPSQLLPSSLLGSIIQCGSVGLQVWASCVKVSRFSFILIQLFSLLSGRQPKGA